MLDVIALDKGDIMSDKDDITQSFQTPFIARAVLMLLIGYIPMNFATRQNNRSHARTSLYANLD